MWCLRTFKTKILVGFFKHTEVLHTHECNSEDSNCKHKSYSMNSIYVRGVGVQTISKNNFKLWRELVGWVPHAYLSHMHLKMQWVVGGIWSIMHRFAEKIAIFFSEKGAGGKFIRFGIHRLPLVRAETASIIVTDGSQVLSLVCSEHFKMSTLQW